jgi:ATP-dependent RNA helicase DeaD
MTTKKTDFTSLVGAELAAALEKKGFASLTSVQEAVLDPALAGRDLRITSQTGSGKTVAIGLALRPVIALESAAAGGIARPRALVVAPTRELAKQVEEELSWLYAPLRARVVTVTGGASYRDERRALGAGPAVIVGTPGRLLDHLKRGGIDPKQLGAVVLDEADRMLDLGFKEDIEAILAFAPADHVTHLVSATFPRDVRILADKVQREPAHVEGTRLGVANVDIDHVIHLVDVRQRVDAIVNLLLATPEAQTLVFARTRAEVARITRELSEAGFDVSSLSGEMEQPARNRALAGFKAGRLHALIATDVAARGIDVQDIARVIHAEPPDDADAYTHRSGRTGRAGKKGTSHVLVSAAGLHRATQLLKRAGVHPRVEPIPSASDIRAAADERIFAELTRDEVDASAPGAASASDATGERSLASDAAIDPRTMALAERLAREGHATRSLARLLSRARHGGPTGPRELRRVEPPSVHEPRAHARAGDMRAPRPSHSPRSPYAPIAPQAPRAARTRDDRLGGWVAFRISWGQEQGADARRLLAVICRRGGIRGTDVGAIHIGRRHSIIDVAHAVSEAFARAAAETDPREPNVIIRREDPAAAASAPGGTSAAVKRSRDEAPTLKRGPNAYRPKPPRGGDASRDASKRRSH